MNNDALIKEVKRIWQMNTLTPSDIENFKQLNRLIEEESTKVYMQLFLDPENQPTQFGTTTQEYREQELKEIKTLLKELASIVRTTHLYGSEMKKLLEKEEVLNNG